MVNDWPYVLGALIGVVALTIIGVSSCQEGHCRDRCEAVEMVFYQSSVQGCSCVREETITVPPLLGEGRETPDEH